jgi:hypothetical protein
MPHQGYYTAALEYLHQERRNRLSISGLRAAPNVDNITDFNVAAGAGVIGKKRHPVAAQDPCAEARLAALAQRDGIQGMRPKVRFSR